MRGAHEGGENNAYSAYPHRTGKVCFRFASVWLVGIKSAINDKGLRAQRDGHFRKQNSAFFPKKMPEVAAVKMVAYLGSYDRFSVLVLRKVRENS